MRLATAFVITGFVACNGLVESRAEGLSVVAGPSLVRGYSPLDKGRLERANEDALASKEAGRNFPEYVTPDNEPQKAEWGFRDARRSTGGPPKNCLALSGGGTRSAAFAIGVLKGLQEQDRLKSLDAISAVSGGAYAMGWYYAQHFHRAETDYQATTTAQEISSRRDAIDKELFSTLPGNIYQSRLEGDFSLFSNIDYAIWATVSVIPGSVVNLFANGLFGWHANTTPARRVYENRLQKLFIADATGRKQEADIDLGELGAFTKGRLPLFIINTTAHIDDERHHFGAPLENSIYEFNAVQYGNTAFGRYRYDIAGRPGENSAAKPIGLARAVSISGAALDGTAFVVGAAPRLLWTALNIDLGYYLDNPRIKSPDQMRTHIVPFPFYLLGRHYAHDAGSTDIYLTDGGHADNLGLFSLVKRRCGEITVVDAEWDPIYRFEAYHIAKKALLREIGVNFSVDEIDKAPPARESVPKEKEIDLTLEDGWTRFAKRPIMTGEICCLPYPGENERIKVTYVKLAFDRSTELSKEHHQIKDQLIGYFDARRDDRLKRGKGYFFPQDPTTDQDFTSEQFMRYRDLGYSVMTSQ